MGKALFGGSLRPQPHRQVQERGETLLLVEADGDPLSVMGGANIQDDKLLGATLDAVVLERPEPPRRNLSISAWVRDTTTGRPGSSWKGKATCPTSEASMRRSSTRRGRIGAWRGGGGTNAGLALEVPRAILARYEKKALNYLGLMVLACVLLWYWSQHGLSVSRRSVGG
jgi:putative transposase